MATISFTNRKSQPAYNGQGILVSCTDSTNFDSLAIGQYCQLDSNNKIGTIVWIDTLANQFKVQPQYMYSNLASNGYANVFIDGEDVNVTVS